MSLLRPIPWYHSRADLIWLVGPFNIDKSPRFIVWLAKLSICLYIPVICNQNIEVNLRLKGVVALTCSYCTFHKHKHRFTVSFYGK
jgi:hypothetical protein